MRHQRKRRWGLSRLSCQGVPSFRLSVAPVQQTYTDRLWRLGFGDVYMGDSRILSCSRTDHESYGLSERFYMASIFSIGKWNFPTGQHPLSQSSNCVEVVQRA
ncbi:hypothetical protein TNCV_2737261 [Trichonephila clavipes]|nr:hypothetical protein TNCV_2737261 [Trichonephila clavipes]